MGDDQKYAQQAQQHLQQGLGVRGFTRDEMDLLKVPGGSEALQLMRKYPNLRVSSVGAHYNPQDYQNRMQGHR
jgi:hypothetical protein